MLYKWLTITVNDIWDENKQSSKQTKNLVVGAKEIKAKNTVRLSEEETPTKYLFN